MLLFDQIGLWVPSKGFVTHSNILKIYRTITIKKKLKIFWDYFWNILEINAFQDNNQSLCKKGGSVLKMADIDNKKLMALLIIAGRSLLLS